MPGKDAGRIWEEMRSFGVVGKLGGNRLVCFPNPVLEF
jgi:hypothetical protein